MGISHRRFKGKIGFFPLSLENGTPYAFVLRGKGETPRNKDLTVEFLDGRGNLLSSYTVRAGTNWKNKVVLISQSDSEDPSICAAWTMTGQWEAWDGPFRCGCAGDLGELYGCEIRIRVDGCPWQ